MTLDKHHDEADILPEQKCIGFNNLIKKHTD